MKMKELNEKIRVGFYKSLWRKKVLKGECDKTMARIQGILQR